MQQNNVQSICQDTSSLLDNCQFSKWILQHILKFPQTLPNKSSKLKNNSYMIFKHQWRSEEEKKLIPRMAWCKEGEKVTHFSKGWRKYSAIT